MSGCLTLMPMYGQHSIPCEIQDEIDLLDAICFTNGRHRLLVVSQFEIRFL